MEFKPRRKLIVNREVQYDILMYMGLFVTGVFITQIFAAWLIVNRLEQQASAGDFSHMTIGEFIARYKTVFLINELLAVGVCLVVGFYLTNRLTSKIVGPLYNIRRILRRNNNDVEANNVVEIKLREGDYFQDLAEDLNTTLRKKQK